MQHTHDLGAWRHDHQFDSGNIAGERGTRAVMWITALAMVAEIVAGWLTNSMALLADGVHMSSHTVAIGLAAFAYSAARRHASDQRFAFGTWKIEVLAGFASAVLLAVLAMGMVVGSIERLWSPSPIQYREALLVAGLGLLVNLVSALILGQAHHGHGEGHGEGRGGHGAHHHGHRHGHAADHAADHGHHAAPPAHAVHHDLNLRSAYLHVMADAATSVLAMVALAGGWLYGWAWLDPVMGLVGAVVIVLWSKRLIADTAKVLLDREMDHPVVEAIRRTVAADGRASDTEITDLHVWRVGKSSYACTLSLLTHDPALTARQVRRWLAPHAQVVHATVEIEVCGGQPGPSVR